MPALACAPTCDWGTVWLTCAAALPALPSSQKLLLRRQLQGHPPRGPTGRVLLRQAARCTSAAPCRHAGTEPDARAYPPGPRVDERWMTQLHARHPSLCLPACPAEDGLRFFVEYDKLAISTGSQGSTFGIPGVEQYTHFLRYVAHRRPGTPRQPALHAARADAAVPGVPLLCCAASCHAVKRAAAAACLQGRLPLHRHPQHTGRQLEQGQHTRCVKLGAVVCVCVRVATGLCQRAREGKQVRLLRLSAGQQPGCSRSQGLPSIHQLRCPGRRPAPPQAAARWIETACCMSWWWAAGPRGLSLLESWRVRGVGFKVGVCGLVSRELSAAAGSTCTLSASCSCQPQVSCCSLAPA